VRTLRSLTSQGHPYARFKRALDTGNPTIALSAASELPFVNLADALALCALMRDGDPGRYSRACAKWLCRYGLEVGGVTLEELRFVAGCLATLVGEHRPAGRKALAQVFSGRSQEKLAEAVRRHA
jgi:hypothetical protein